MLERNRLVDANRTSSWLGREARSVALGVVVTLGGVGCGSEAESRGVGTEPGMSATGSAGNSGAASGTNDDEDTGTGADATTTNIDTLTDGSETTSGPLQPVDCEPAAWEYTPIDAQGRRLIDLLYVVSPAAVVEIEGRGQALDEYFSALTDVANETLARSDVDSSFVRYIGAHQLIEEDFERTGVFPALARDNIDFALGWLSSYREAYGADHVAMVVSTANSDGGANAFSPGFVSSYSIDLLDAGALRHELGHNMGGGHCNDGQAGVVTFGFPMGGYSAGGTPVEGAPLTGGTSMCGNDVGFFSNPDITLTVEELEAFAAEGVVPAQDYAGVLGAGGSLVLGDPQFANMAGVWRGAEEEHAVRTPQSRFSEDPCHDYPAAGCAGFYGGPGYGDFLFELCAGETLSGDAQLADVASVRVGDDVHVSLYSNPDFGESSRFGGIINRLAFSSPSLQALAAHRGTSDVVASVTVYEPVDREAHFRRGGEYDLFSAAAPAPAVVDVTTGAEVLRLLPDQTYWASTAAVRRESVVVPFAVDFGYASGTVDPDFADGMVFWFGKNGSAYVGQEPPRETLGFIADGTGFGVRFATWPAETLAVIDGNANVVGEPVPTTDAFTDGVFVDVRVEVTAGSVTVFIGGVEVLQRSITPNVGEIGFSVGTGAFGSQTLIREPVVTQG